MLIVEVELTTVNVIVHSLIAKRKPGKNSGSSTGLNFFQAFFS